jgi:hypothetical protein
MRAAGKHYTTYCNICSMQIRGYEFNKVDRTKLEVTNLTEETELN